MRLFGLIRIPPLRKILRASWMRIPLIIIGLACLVFAIWWGFPKIPWWPLATVWLRLTVIGVLLTIIFTTMFIKWRRRRKAAALLEEELIQEPVGDGEVLSERLSEALGKLKKSGGKTYLYDLPWYIIIGPPGAGKTTALQNSGIEFPGTDMETVEGFGGTKNCDWWFAEEAVLIDTAGRYTTQDSDAEADKLSWSAFLTLLKKGRPKQPINGVVLAFSAEDMMTATEEDLVEHAVTVRARLAEIHETLKIDFPVYVLFTKADLISGFREYFSSFSQSRRKAVWGATFQTKDRKAQTWQDVPTEFDALVARLSDETIDRMSEEPDGISRISIFGLPGQMALLRDNVADFLRRVFEPTRYDSNAILRGFYFTSGTQEGTPIDQVLGAMSRNAGEDAGAFQPAFMSGKGKSFFLHDLMRKVIFAERDWVNHDAKAVRRAFILRTAALSLIGLLTVGLMVSLGTSFWQNAGLIRTAQDDSSQYIASARPRLAETFIDDPNPSSVLGDLNRVRDMATGVGDTAEQEFFEGFGLGQRRSLSTASARAYSDSLERLLRPRMVLQVENDLERHIQSENVAEIYSALKVYILLSGQQEGASDDDAIIAYFNGSNGVWDQMFRQQGQRDERIDLGGHVVSMLSLDDTRPPVFEMDVPTFEIDGGLIDRARREIVDLPLAEQRWAVIKDEALTADGLRPWILIERLGDRAGVVFRTKSGDDLSTVQVPALFTFEGYWGFFVDGLEEARDELAEDSWVLGEVAEQANYESQLAGLEGELQRLYQVEFRDAWNEMLDQLEMMPMSTDSPQYNALQTVGADPTSPLLRLVEEMRDETRLVRLFDELGALEIDPAALASGDIGGALGNAAQRRLYASGGAFQRIVFDYLLGGGKAQEEAGGGLAEDSLQRQVERIGESFEDWHILLDGEPSPIGAVLTRLRDLRSDRFAAASSPTLADEQALAIALAALTSNNSALPRQLAGWLNQVENEFRTVSQDATFTNLNRELNEQVSQFCLNNVASGFPFGDGRAISSAAFGDFFGPGGRMDTYYTNLLAPHVTRTTDGLQPRPGSTVGERLSPATLRQFDRAQAIRDAFFTSGSSEPAVRIFISHVSSSQSVQLAILTVNGRSFRTAAGDQPVAFEWPGDGAAVSVELFPVAGTSQANFNGGRWAIVDFMRRGRADPDGAAVSVTHNIGGRSITYRIEADAPTMPFLMPELADFSCPTSLE